MSLKLEEHISFRMSLWLGLLRIAKYRGEETIYISSISSTESWGL